MTPVWILVGLVVFLIIRISFLEYQLYNILKSIEKIESNTLGTNNFMLAVFNYLEEYFSEDDETVSENEEDSIDGRTTIGSDSVSLGSCPDSAHTDKET